MLHCFDILIVCQVGNFLNLNSFYLFILFEFGMPGWKGCGLRADKSFGEARS
jgi:hypothetical protein